MGKYGCLAVALAAVLFVSASASAKDCETDNHATHDEGAPAALHSGDEAPAIVPGSASPGHEIQMNDDADTNTATVNEGDYASPRHERNLQEAMEPKTSERKSSAGHAPGTKTGN